jgi:hypothetical protein
MDYKRGDRTRGGVDGYRHREGALKKVIPWIKTHKSQEFNAYYYRMVLQLINHVLLAII